MNWIRANIKAIVPFLGAVVMALKPWFLGAHYGLAEWLSVASLVLASAVTYIVPNVETGVAKYAKTLIVVTLAGLGAAQNVLPGGISRADVWTIGTALVAAVLTFALPTTTTRAVKANGDGHMGDHLKQV